MLRVDILFTCLSFGTTRDGLPSKVTSKLMKTPIKTGEKMNCIGNTDSKTCKKDTINMEPLNKSKEDLKDVYITFTIILYMEVRRKG
jgi:hypothetical protein